MNKPHLFFQNPIEGISDYKQRPGGSRGGDKKEEQENKDYSLMADTFNNCLARYQADSQERIGNRSIDISMHFDAIELYFFAGFNESNYKSYYIDKFGLVLLRLSHFNRKGLFAIEDNDKFEFFLAQLQEFIANPNSHENVSFDPKILFIKNFKFFSTEDRLGNINSYDVIHLSFMGNDSFIDSIVTAQKNDLIKFLEEKGIEYEIDESFGELYNIDSDTLKVILDNFDFIYATCSGSGAIITPSKFNTPKREYGFEVTNSEEDLPIIGVIDTGVSSQTPLNAILIGEDGEFDSTQTGSFNDTADHGTGVAAFAAFGTKLIPNYNGPVQADAKILPIKILDGNSGAISQKQVVNLIRDAHEKYDVRIFTLTIGYSDFPLKDNQEFSSYAAMLDQLAFELDILIFISTTNHFVRNLSKEAYPEMFKTCNANIAPPAESMNNITIGATANNFENSNVLRLSGNLKHPALYSRKFHYDFENRDIFNRVTENTYLRKPDLLVGGGDYQEDFVYNIPIIDESGEAGLEVLSSHLNERTFRAIGTSYSAPLAANYAARILKLYPNLKMQSVKALLINSSDEIEFGEIFSEFSSKMKNRISGYGELNSSVLFSNDNKVTIVVEDYIPIGKIKLYPIYLPEYLNNAKRKKGLLKFTSTLCFKFQPQIDHQLLYCPVHVSYAIGRNVPLEEPQNEDNNSENTQGGYNGTKSEKFKLGEKGWVQDFYYREKIVSNVQKHSFNVKRQDIIDESNTFKLAVNAAFHKTLTDVEGLENDVHFSIVITIEQKPIKDEQLSSLYDGLIAINALEAIGSIEQEVDIDNQY